MRIFKVECFLKVLQYLKPHQKAYVVTMEGCQCDPMCMIFCLVLNLKEQVNDSFIDYLFAFNVFCVCMLLVVIPVASGAECPIF